MPADVRVNSVEANIELTDATSLLTPAALERIVEAVVRRIAERESADRDAAIDTRVGAGREEPRRR